MTENEKIKAYDEALKKASAAHKDEDRHLKATLERIFLELKEEDDERIKKNCIHFLELQKQHHATTFKIEECIDWLEKQGEQKPTIEMKSAEESLDISSEEYNKIVDKLIYDEQKHTDKVEPKFKVGDWVVRGNTIAQILDIQEQYYIGLDINGKDFVSSRFLSGNKIHLWTIQDAKDGDVLIDKSHIGECVFIFKEARASDIKTDVNNPLAIIGYCGINHIGFTSRLSGLGFGDTVNCTYYPATKEQRDTLMKAMNNAGYKWDADKKELFHNQKQNGQKMMRNALTIVDLCTPIQIGLSGKNQHIRHYVTL